jgi:hypothetical protein
MLDRSNTPTLLTFMAVKLAPLADQQAVGMRRAPAIGGSDDGCRYRVFTLTTNKPRWCN